MSTSSVLADARTEAIAIPKLPTASLPAVHPPPVSELLSDAELLAPPRAGDEPQSLEGIRRRHDQEEKERLVEALEASGGNVSAAARNVGISRYQMLRRLSKYGLR